MNNIRRKLEEKGFVFVIENENGMSFVNEKIKLCVIYVKTYDSEFIYSDSFLRQILEQRYSFAQKGTLCLFDTFKNSSHDGGEFETQTDVEACEFYAIKIHVSKIDSIPSSDTCNNDITLTLEEMKDGDDVGDYTIDPFKPMDGIACSNYILYLSTVTENKVIKYPPIIKGMSTSWFKYQGGKFFNIK